jgi:LytS/YehU family sensor histidine kinase
MGHEEIADEVLNTMNIIKAFLSFFFLFGSFLAASTAIKLFQRWIMDNFRIHELERNTMEAELEQLKNQITPHFLFNTLNNMNVLIQTEPEKASQTVMMLSDLLRYQLYDSTRAKVFLSSDIRFLTDFLNLEKIRRDKFEFTVATQGEINNLLLPPLLFIPFVENAVKHSQGGKKTSCIHLKFTIIDGELGFICINSMPEKGSEKEYVGGLGLANIRRRLDLLFGEKYQLNIHEKKNSYRVYLNIVL